jgi:hypothetical protein
MKVYTYRIYKGDFVNDDGFDFEVETKRIEYVGERFNLKGEVTVVLYANDLCLESINWTNRLIEISCGYSIITLRELKFGEIKKIAEIPLEMYEGI